jgi:hypothetical protein
LQRVLQQTDALLQKAAMCDDDEEEFTYLREAVGIRERSLHRYNLSLLSARSNLFTLALVNGDWDCAIHQCKEMIST